jgi:hypothetical protein
MQDIKEFFYWAFGGLLVLITSITGYHFRASQAAQDRRIDALEDKGEKTLDKFDLLRRDLAIQLHNNDQKDAERHERDRLEAKKDLAALEERGDRAHDIIVKRLDKLIIGNRD